MNQAIANKALNYVAVTSVMTKKAMEELSTYHAAREKAASVRPDLLKQMMEVGCVSEQQKEAAEVMLASHPETLGLLKSAVDVIAKLQGKLKKQAADLGEGVDDKDVGLSKQAGTEYDSLTDPFVGRRTSEKKASDVAILKVLDAPS